MLAQLTLCALQKSRGTNGNALSPAFSTVCAFVISQPHAVTAAANMQRLLSEASRDDALLQIVDARGAVTAAAYGGESVTLGLLDRISAIGEALVRQVQRKGGVGEGGGAGSLW